MIVVAQARWSVEGMTAKEKIRDILEAQPDDASYDEILRELAFQRMVERGLSDARRGRVISNDQMGEQIRRWRA
jgi:predicted transcriptional regulator